MKTNDQKVSKPLVLEIDEAEKETVAAVNDIMAKHNLPCAFFEPIIAGIHRQLVDGKKNEVANATAQYEAQVAAAQTKEE